MVEDKWRAWGTPAPGEGSPEEPAGSQRYGKRGKVTADDIQAGWSERLARRRERRQQRDPRTAGRLGRTLTASALGIGILGLSLAINEAGNRHEAAASANEGTLNALEGALESLNPEDGAAAGTKLAADIAAAQVRSNELAAAQNRFGAIAYEGNSEPATNDGRPNPAVLRGLEHRRELAGFFDPNALVLSDAEAYSFRTEDLLGQDRIDPRQPWFTRYESAGAGSAQKAASPDSYAWQTVSVTPSGTPGVLEVVWTTADATTGELLAWATARYTADTGVFRNLTVQQTTRGDSQSLRVQTAAPGANKEEEA